MVQLRPFRNVDGWPIPSNPQYAGERIWVDPNKVVSIQVGRHGGFGWFGRVSVPVVVLTLLGGHQVSVLDSLEEVQAALRPR